MDDYRAALGDLPRATGDGCYLCTCDLGVLVMKKFDGRDIVFLLVWVVVMLAIVAMFTTCSSPTQIEEECIYRPDLAKWVGPGCDDEEEVEEEISQATIDLIFITGMNTPLEVSDG